MASWYNSNKKVFVLQGEIPNFKEHLLSAPENIILLSDVPKSKIIFTSEKAMRAWHRDGIAYGVEDLGIPDKNGVYVYDDMANTFSKSRERIFCLSASIDRRQINVSLFKWFERYSLYPCVFQNVADESLLKKKNNDGDNFSLN